MRPAYALLTALEVLLATGAIGMYAYGYVPPYDQAWVCITFYGIAAISVPAACAISSHLTRKTRVTHSLVPWLLLVPTCLVPACAIIVIAVATGGAEYAVFQNPAELIMVFAGYAAVGAGIGAVLYVLLLPFAILTFRNQFYRDRMRALLHAPDLPANAEDAEG